MMSTRPLDAVTGASGYTGKYITRLLLDQGHLVRNLTGHPDRPHPFGDRVSTVRYRFDDPDALAASLQGVSVLYNTYWVRFTHGKTSYDLAVENNLKLIEAARKAGVRRIVHVSITNPDEASPLPYFKGKGRLERAIRESGLSHAILRPTVIFGTEDILINNIAWLLRRFPVFAIPGNGQYRLQPIFVEDMARLAVGAGQQTQNLLIDAIGPDTYTFAELVDLIRRAVGSRARLFKAPPMLAYGIARMISWAVRDVVLTRDEVQGLMADLLVTTSPQAGHTRLADWLQQNRETVGAGYASELQRHFLHRA